ncbi:trehalose operon repressor [[Clostridium] colinum]|uniref:trehalose operon repressor n=1 Tax=[Clostridium] colinum TaxID=36835 RepID=UPI0020247F39|nr:trehalose operon repressor [[Clostridium] colinum]
MNNKYLTIYNELLEKIKTGYYKPNDLLPSESELMKIYNVSRDTIRKSLNILTQEGYIQKSQGKGSFVLDINRFTFPVSGVVSFKEIGKKLGKTFETDVKQLECIIPDKYISKDLNLKKNEKVWKIIRTRKIGKESIIFDKDYIVQKFVNNLNCEICKNSLYEYIENDLNLKISYAKKQITVEKSTEEDEKYLDLKEYNMVVVVISYTHLEDNNVFQYTESRHRPDKFVFVDFARRNKI